MLIPTTSKYNAVYITQFYSQYPAIWLAVIINSHGVYVNLIWSDNETNAEDNAEDGEEEDGDWDSAGGNVTPTKQYHKEDNVPSMSNTYHIIAVADNYHNSSNIRSCLKKTSP